MRIRQQVLLLLTRRRRRRKGRRVKAEVVGREAEGGELVLVV